MSWNLVLILDTGNLIELFSVCTIESLCFSHSIHTYPITRTYTHPRAGNCDRSLHRHCVLVQGQARKGRSSLFLSEILFHVICSFSEYVGCFCSLIYLSDSLLYLLWNSQECLCKDNFFANKNCDIFR